MRGSAIIVVKNSQNYDNKRGFLLLSYKLFHHLDRLRKGQAKANCLVVFLSLMKYAWKSDGYKCAIRQQRIVDDTLLSRSTVKRSLYSLAKLNVIKIIKGKSGCTYVVNTSFLKPEKDPTWFSQNPPMRKSEPTHGSHRATLEDTLNINTLSEVDKIINKGLSRDDTLKLLANLPLQDLTNDTNNPYYVKLAIALKEDNEKPKVELNAAQVLREMSKKTNMNYKMKVEYNKRNNIKPWENK